jgi:Delta6-protoilludene synthase
MYPLLDKGLSLFLFSLYNCSDTVSDGARVGSDLMVVLFIFDEFTDKVDGDGARVYAEMVMDAIRNPHKKRPQDEPKLGEIARQ